MSQEESEGVRAVREVKEGLAGLLRPAVEELARGLRQLCDACNEMNKCLAWPDEALRELTRAVRDNGPMRRLMIRREYALARSKRNVEKLKREGRCR